MVIGWKLKTLEVKHRKVNDKEATQHKNGSSIKRGSNVRKSSDG